ncbi:MAG: purine-nucleoside phosphorylase [Candidatus Eisenbacteria bacterium]|nr:purine-nucleoside phosphorylase [Candidatus Eisenbacteria bacterium]
MSTTPDLPTTDLEMRVAEAVAAIRQRTPLVPQVGLTLGSGLGGVVDAIPGATIFHTRDLPHWPASTVQGHAGRLAVGTWCGVPVAALSGRSHRYEDYTLDKVTFAVRVMHALGARTMIFTNAVGAIHPELKPADVMLATGHLNFIGKRGLFTPGELAERFAGRPVADLYSPALRALLLDAALQAGVKLHQGVLMGGHGPTYETASEVRMAARLGAHVACMSTVHEVTLAAHLGCEAASLSCITNKATGISATPLTHHEVTEVANEVAGKLRGVLEKYLAARA